MSVKEANIKSKAPESAKPKPQSLKYLRDKMAQKVTGIFHFFEVPGGTLPFVFREFKGEEILNYTMTDGETYTIPLGVARHLNKNGWYPEYGYFQTEGSYQGVKNSVPLDSKVMRIAKKIRRFGFQSLEFIDIDDLPTAESQIVEVQTVG